MAPCSRLQPCHRHPRRRARRWSGGTCADHTSSARCSWSSSATSSSRCQRCAREASHRSERSQRARTARRDHRDLGSSCSSAARHPWRVARREHVQATTLVVELSPDAPRADPLGAATAGRFELGLTSNVELAVDAAGCSARGLPGSPGEMRWCARGTRRCAIRCAIRCSRFDSHVSVPARHSPRVGTVFAQTYPITWGDGRLVPPAGVGDRPLGAVRTRVAMRGHPELSHRRRAPDRVQKRPTR